MRHNLCMRFAPLVLVITVTSCGGRATQPTLPRSPAVVPASDLAAAKSTPRADTADAAHLAAKDPRVVDLDIIRIRATSSGPGGDKEMTSVASADLFRDAGEAVKAGRTQEAITRYRQLIAEFPDSIYAPVSLFNIAAIFDQQGNMPDTIATLRELVKTYPDAHESIEGHLFIAALQADHQQFADATRTLDEVLARQNLTFADRIEAHARKGYVELEQAHYDASDAELTAAIAEWRKAPHIEDPYYIAMAHYYRGELAHKKFAAAPVRLPDDQLLADLEVKRVLAVQAYDRWKDALQFKHAYWATASGYQMSQIFVELWQVTVTAPYPTRLAPADRAKYITDVHERVREHLAKALEGHRMNVELAKAYGVDTAWSKGSEQQAVKVMQMLARDSSGDYVTP
jgi:predicted negative regulator of RcsB-dependent stress response